MSCCCVRGGGGGSGGDDDDDNNDVCRVDASTETIFFLFRGRGCMLVEGAYIGDWSGGVCLRVSFVSSAGTVRRACVDSCGGRRFFFCARR